MFALQPAPTAQNTHRLKKNRTEYALCPYIDDTIWTVQIHCI